MSKILVFLLAVSMLGYYGSQKYSGSTKASVILAGGVIKAQNTVVDKKYKRKDCPICKGTGWYISGDGIKKVDCGYCEPDKTANVITTQPLECVSGTCKIPTIKR